MNTFSRSAILLAIITLLGAGCGASTGSSSQPGSRAGTEAHTTSPVADGSGCLNLYFPLKAGSAIEYSMDNGATHVPMTIAVQEHTTDSIKLNYTFIVKG